MRGPVLVLLATACSQSPPPPPPDPPIAVAKPSDARPTPPTEPEPLAAPSVEAVDAGAAAPPTTDAGPRATFHCFSWAHLRDFSTDCYRTANECDVERKKMGPRAPRSCETQVSASCTNVGRRGTNKDERCFGGTANCGRYRVMVTRNGLETTPCVNE